MKMFLLFGLLALISPSLINAEKEWWQTMSLYQIYPRSWFDSDGNGVGDLPGIASKLPHLVDSGLDAFWISPIYNSPMKDFGYDIANFTGIDPTFGTMEDFDNVATIAKSLGLKLIMDFVPNHSSDKHEWFIKSLAKEDPYTDFYVWHNGTYVNGIRSEPNNWVSVFGGSAWTYKAERDAYYLHQFAEEQPDLDFRNENVVQAMKDVLVFWLDKGVDGFRVDAIPHLFEVQGYPDEPVSGDTDDPTNYGYLNHDYTKDQPETYDMIRQWRVVMDEYALRTDNVTRVIMMEAYANISKTMEYFDAGAHFPFNFGFISNVGNSPSAAEIKTQVIDQWLNNVPKDGTSNWVIGNHDKSRVATRYGSALADALNMLDLLLPGVSVTYYGEEIGMEDQWISWEDSMDPQGCNAGEDAYETMSRDPARTPFQWDATTSAGFSTNSTTWLPVHDDYQTLNLAAQKEADVSHYKVYQALTTLRKESVTKEGTVNVQLLNDNVLAFIRELEDSDPVIVVANFADSTETVSLGVFEAAPENLKVSIASIHSSLKTGEIVSKSSLEVSPYAGLVLRSGAIAINSSIIATLFAAILAHLRHW